MSFPTILAADAIFLIIPFSSLRRVAFVVCLFVFLKNVMFTFGFLFSYGESRPLIYFICNCFIFGWFVVTIYNGFLTETRQVD